MDNQIIYPKGSIWRKWDLQIHPPQCKHADQYKVNAGIDIWDKFLNYLKKTDVEVFGITDYFSIDGYEKLLAKIKKDDVLNQKIFFPNIEFRMDISVNKTNEVLQCHLIFDNLCKIEDIKKFLLRLKLKNTKADGSACYCIDPDIKECGGYDKVSVEEKVLRETLNETFGNKNPYIIVGIASGMGSNRGSPNSNIKKELADQFDECCGFFFGNKSAQEYFLKEDRYENKKKKALPKAVISASDCHSFNDCDERLGKKFTRDNQGDDNIYYGFTWIKADPNFEGLKQILYEPKERTEIKYEKPEKKKTYFLIDKVRFIDNSGQNNFPADYIEINPNLITLIGGKSTGKSLLLYYTSKTIDAQEVETRFSSFNEETQYNFDENPDFNFEVVWADGESNFLKNGEKSERKILYIPQRYLNNLSEKNVRSKETLNNFVLAILLQDDNLNEEYENNLSKIKTFSKDIPAKVNDLYQLSSEIEEIEENIKQLGEEKGIKKYLSQLQREADEIKNKSGLSEKEIEKYEQLLNDEKETSTSISILLDDKKSLIQFKQNIAQQLENLISLRDDQAEFLGDSKIKDQFKKEFDTFDEIKKTLLESVDSIIASIDSEDDTKSEIGLRNKKLEEIKDQLSPFMTKIKLQDELKEKNDAIKEEQKKLDRINLEKKNLESRKKNYEKEKKFIVDSYKNILNIYDTMRNKFKQYDNKFEDISLNVSVGFNEEKFNNEVIQGCLNKNDIKRVFSFFKREDECFYHYNSTQHMDFVSELLDSVTSAKIKTLKNKPAKDAVLKILENYFNLDFKITYKNDSLDKMSPGKKGLVLLRILIDLSNKEWPIILDQPDDDLDNRSVYNDLVSFIKKKKKLRQIIIATHNPNLVVGTDAEEIIVANQAGQEKNRENKKYVFEYVSGALENTFELTKKEQKAILFRKGIRQHVYEILEGGKEAFQKRERKYDFNY